MPDVWERTIDGHKIQRQGAGHYLCKSRSRPGVSYSIDIEENDGLGNCQCEDFIYRRLPDWRKVRANYDFYRCRHIRAVRNHVLDQMLQFKREKEKLPP